MKQTIIWLIYEDAYTDSGELKYCQVVEAYGNFPDAIYRKQELESEDYDDRQAYLEEYGDEPEGWVEYHIEATTLRTREDFPNG